MEYATLGSFIVAAIALLISVYNSVKKGNKEDGAQTAMILTKLDSISDDLREVKKDVMGLRQAVQDNHDRILKLEMSLDTAWKRIDEIRKEG